MNVNSYAKFNGFSDLLYLSSNSNSELIQTQMAQKPMLRAEVGMRMRRANKESSE